MTAVQIQTEANERARTEWEAEHIEKMAIAKAKLEAEAAMTSATETKKVTFRNHLTSKVSGCENLRFKDMEAKIACENKFNFGVTKQW